MSSYTERMSAKLEELRGKDDIVILAIESSCDETACAVTRGRRILSNVIASQIDIHKRFGGVVPEIASRNHVMSISGVVSEALAKSGVDKHDIDCVAVTYGSGLLGALLVGVSFAKAFAYALDKPLLAVNHIKGHIAANYLAFPDLEPPYLCLIASGGHTAVAKVSGLDEAETLGSTQDDACGEAFDKVARVLGLEYPGGPQIQKLAESGRNTVPLPTPLKGETGYDFSYSGLKTAVINYVHTARQKGEEICAADIAKSFQTKAVDIMTDVALRAAIDTGMKKIVIAGGVAANAYLRESMEKKAREAGIKTYYPPLSLCTDNAAMVASQAYNMIKSGRACAGTDLDAVASIPIRA